MAAVLFLMLVAFGCESSPPAPSGIAKTLRLGPRTSLQPQICAEHCLPKGIALARAALGLDPTVRDERIPTDPSQLFRLLSDESASSGGVIESISVESALNEDLHRQAPHTILIDERGHLHTLLGSITVNGHVLFQLIHGNSAVDLRSGDELLQAGFKSAWRCSSRLEGIPVKVGASIVHFDRICHNFGEVKPNATLTCDFTITNDGQSELVFGKPTTSCSCTTTQLDESTVLRPGSTMPFSVTIRSTNTISLRQSVLLRIVEKQTKASQLVELMLFGSQRELKRISPTILDYGVVIPGRSCSRTLTLQEVATDRCALLSIDPGKLPIVCTVEETPDPQGYRLYKVRCELSIDEAAHGKSAGSLLISTDSSFSPTIKIPIVYEVPPPVSLYPSILALGELPIGKTVQRRVRFKPRTPVPFSIHVSTTPPGVNTEIAKVNTELELVISATVNEVGIWHAEIKGRVNLEECTIPFTIPCSAVGTTNKKH